MTNLQSQLSKPATAKGVTMSTERAFHIASALDLLTFPAPGYGYSVRVGTPFSGCHVIDGFVYADDGFGNLHRPVDLNVGVAALLYYVDGVVTIH